MKSDNPHTTYYNRRIPFLFEAILILIGMAFCAYIIYSLGSTPASHTPVTQTPLPSLPANAAQGKLTSSEQLIIFEKIWQFVNDYYLYPDFNGLDWNAIYTEYNEKIEAGLNEDVFYQTIEELIGKLENKRNMYYPPTSSTITDVGVGFNFAIIVNNGENRAVINFVQPHSQANKAGILLHDRILTVDGKPIPVDSQELTSMIKGKPGTKVKLTIQTLGQEPRQVELNREGMDTPFAVPYKELTTYNGKNVGYLVLVTFTAGSLKDQITEAIKATSSVKPLDGLILDVRMNPGGETPTMFEALSYFTHGTIGNLIMRNEIQVPIDIPDQDVNGSSQIPLAVLISPSTASAGALFAGLLQDMGRAYLVGETTYSIEDMGQVFYLPDGSVLVIAIASVKSINHPDLNFMGTGIAPDMVVRTDWNEFMSENDPVIRAALDYFDR